MVSLAIAMGGYCYYRQQTREIRSEKYNELKAIAGLKVDQIVERRNKRLADARTFSENVFLRSAVGEWAADARQCLPESRDAGDAETALPRTTTTQSAVLAGAEGQVLLALDPGTDRSGNARPAVGKEAVLRQRCGLWRSIRVFRRQALP